MLESFLYRWNHVLGDHQRQIALTISEGYKIIDGERCLVNFTFLSFKLVKADCSANLFKEKVSKQLIE